MSWKRHGMSWLLTAAALALLYLPLRAAESPPPAAPAPPAPAAAADSADADDAAAADAEAAQEAQEQQLESVSVDNNLTFPVDI